VQPAYRHTPGRQTLVAPLSQRMTLMKLVAAVAMVAFAASAGAQEVAVLDLAFTNAGATLREPTDSMKVAAATGTLRDTLAHLPSIRVVDSARTATAIGSPEAQAAAAGKPCNVIVACARAVGHMLGVPWVIMGKVSKTSNLIWLLSAELIDVGTGALALDDDFELKGDPTTMVHAGVGLFAGRAARRMAGRSSPAAGR